MQFSPDDNKYLTTEVFTAPPQKLHLMLIEAAIRLIGRARQQWQARDTGRACESLLHAQEIVDELMTGMNRDANPPLVDQVSAVYQFVARRLREANTERDEKKLQDVLRILEIERETWRQVCVELNGQGHAQEEYVARQEAAERAVPPAPHLYTREMASDMSIGGFSIEV